jgi:predicted DNA-binding protein (MmcQ/YjbR family)
MRLVDFHGGKAGGQERDRAVVPRVAVENDRRARPGVSCGAVAGAREKLLDFALTFPETAQDSPWEEDVVVKVRGKIFVFLGPVGSRRISVKLAESNAHALAVDSAQPTGYGLGRSGWVTVPLRAPGVSLDVLRDWIEESYRIVAPKRLVAELDSGVS